MNQPLKVLTALVCATALLFTACIKGPKNKKTCSSTLHGYSYAGSLFGSASTPYSVNHGIISLSSAGITTSGSFSSNIIFSNKAAFNTADNCYYVFGHTGTYPALTKFLYKIDAGGTTTAYSFPDTTNTYSSLLYNNVTNKLYCIKNRTSLAEITLGGTSFTTTTVVSTVDSLLTLWTLSDITNLAVDHSSGDMYFGTRGTPYHVEKYHPGATSTSVIATLSDTWPLMELRYNPNDNMLYAIKYVDTSAFSFVKINPATGVLTTLAASPFVPWFNPEFFSASLDPCSDRYIISTEYNITIPSSIVYQLNMTGTIVQTDTVACYYQGLDVAY